MARSTFRSQNVQNTPFSDHFWNLRCRKSARRCGAKHISKSKCIQNTQAPDHFWKLRCRKSARRCGAKEIKMHKTPHVRATFGGSDVEKVHAAVARSTFRSQNVKNTRDSDHFWRFRCRFTWLHYTTLHYTTLHYTTLHYTTLRYLSLHFTTLHHTTLHYTTNTTTLHR